MAIHDDLALFSAVIKNGGFRHAADELGCSVGLVSRRIAKLESRLGVTLIKRTTRQIMLTPEGELIWQYTERTHDELDNTLNLISNMAQKPKGVINLGAPISFGRNYLTPILMNFLSSFPDIRVNLMLDNRRIDPIKEKLDLVIRGAGYLAKPTLKDSTFKMKVLIKDKINLYASPAYLQINGQPKEVSELVQHKIINFNEGLSDKKEEEWLYHEGSKQCSIKIKSSFTCNDVDSNLIACQEGYGIGRFTTLSAAQPLASEKLHQILQQYHWGDYFLFAIYPQQKSLPKRTRLLLDYIKGKLQ